MVGDSGGEGDGSNVSDTKDGGCVGYQVMRLLHDLRVFAPVVRVSEHHQLVARSPKRLNNHLIVQYNPRLVRRFPSLEVHNTRGKRGKILLPQIWQDPACTEGVPPWSDPLEDREIYGRSEDHGPRHINHKAPPQFGLCDWVDEGMVLEASTHEQDQILLQLFADDDLDCRVLHHPGARQRGRGQRIECDVPGLNCGSRGRSML